MNRLAILLAIILTSTFAATEFVNAQNKIPVPQIPPPKIKPTDCDFPTLRQHLQGLGFGMSIETTGPIKITKDQVKQIDEYERYLKELSEWNLEAIDVAERLEKEGKLYPTKAQETGKNGVNSTKMVVTSPVDSWRIQSKTTPTTRILFPKSVVDEMRPAPDRVTAPTATETNLELKFTNDTDREVVINDDIYCDVSRINISVSGAEVLQIPRSNAAQTTDWRTGRYVTLKPGKSHRIKIERLRFGYRGVDGICLRTPGKHTVSVQYYGVVNDGVKRCTSPPHKMAFATVEVILDESTKQ